MCAGEHMQTMQKLFPMVTFDVYDTPPPTTSDFPGPPKLETASVAGAAPGIHWMHRRIMEHDMKHYQKMNQGVLLVSDIRGRAHRSSNSSLAKKEISDYDVVNDLRLQERMTTKMMPR